MDSLDGCQCYLKLLFCFPRLCGWEFSYVPNTLATRSTHPIAQHHLEELGFPADWEPVGKDKPLSTPKLFSMGLVFLQTVAPGLTAARAHCRVTTVARENADGRGSFPSEWVRHWESRRAVRVVLYLMVLSPEEISYCLVYADCPSVKPKCSLLPWKECLL